MLKVINSFAKFIKMRNAYNRTYRELSKLSDRELSDIGISRYDITMIAEESAIDEAAAAKRNVDVVGALKTLFNARLALR